MNTNNFYKYGFYIFGAAIIGLVIYFSVQNPRQNVPLVPSSINVTNSPTDALKTQNVEGNDTSVSKGTEAPTHQIQISPTRGTPIATISPQPVQQNTPEMNPTMVPTSIIVTAVPTAHKPTSTETIASPVIIGVPGITMTQMGEILTKEENFSCTQSSASTINSLTCDYNNKMLTNRLMNNAQAYGREPNKILFIYSTVIQDNLDQDAAIKNFNVIAALPFTNSPKFAAEARAWVTSQLPTIQNPTDERVTTIGGIYFRLYGFPKSWFFEMGDSTSMD